MQSIRDNKAEYQAFCQQNKQVPVFFQPFWLNATCGSVQWDVLLHRDNGNSIDGFLVYYHYRKLGKLFIRKPPLAPHSGFWFAKKEFTNYHKEYSYQKKVMGELLRKLPSHFSCELLLSYEVKNWIPLKSMGFSATPFYQFIFPFREIFDDHIIRFKDNIKRELKKSEKSIITEKCDQVDLLHEMCNVPLKGVLKLDKEVLSDLYTELVENKMGFILEARDKNGTPQGAFLIAHDEHTFYTIAGGMNEEGRRNGAYAALIFKALKLAHKEGKELNLCGSILSGPAEKFIAFGAQMKIHFLVSRSNKLFELIRVLFR